MYAASRPAAERGPPGHTSWVSRPGDGPAAPDRHPGLLPRFGARHAPPLQSPFPGPNVIGTPLPRACRCHSPVWRCHCRPERRVSTKCFLFTFCRGAIYPCSSYEITTPSALLRNCNSCTPPALCGRSPFRRSLQGAPVCAPSWGTLRTPLPGPSTTASSGVPVRDFAQADSGGRGRGLTGPDSGLRRTCSPSRHRRWTKCNFQSWRCPLRPHISDCTNAISKAATVR